MSEWVVQLYEQAEKEEQRWLDSLPKCDECGQPIQDEEFYLVHDTKICPSCLEDCYMKYTEDYTKSEEW